MIFGSYGYARSIPHDLHESHLAVKVRERGIHTDRGSLSRGSAQCEKYSRLSTKAWQGLSTAAMVSRVGMPIPFVQGIQLLRGSSALEEAVASRVLKATASSEAGPSADGSIPLGPGIRPSPIQKNHGSEEPWVPIKNSVQASTGKRTEHPLRHSPTG